jgi:hypothetical protein
LSNSFLNPLSKPFPFVAVAARVGVAIVACHVSLFRIPQFFSVSFCCCCCCCFDDDLKKKKKLLIIILKRRRRRRRSRRNSGIIVLKEVIEITSQVVVVVADDRYLQRGSFFVPSLVT